MRLRDMLLLTLAGFALAGCYLDPYNDPRKWAMTPAPTENLAVQAANPADLIAGHSSPDSNGVAASAAVDKALGGASGAATGLQTPPPALNIGGS